jgi:hypothetical protein
VCRARDFWKGVLGLSEISSANYFKTLRILLSVTVTDTVTPRRPNRGLLCALLRDSIVLGMCDGANRAALLH